MGELARQRKARDLWISRGHVLAAGTGAVLLTVSAFALGIVLGSERSAHAAAATSPLPAAPDDRLVELLARVEASAEADGGAERLTFPDALSGEEVDWAPAAAPADPVGAAEIDPASEVAVPEVDRTPAGDYTVTVLATSDGGRALALRDQLRSRELPAWVDAARVDGELVHTVHLGGFGTRAQASDALGAWRYASPDLPLLDQAQPEPID